MKLNTITIRLLISIDRSRGLDDAWDTLQLAKQYAAHVSLFFSSFFSLKFSLVNIFEVLYPFPQIFWLYNAGKCKAC